MRVVVSNVIEPTRYKGYTVVPSFKTVKTELNFSEIQCLIIHRFDDGDFEAGMHLAELIEKGMKNIIYICDTPSPIITSALKGLETAKYYTDEFYLDSDADLDVILDEENIDDTSLAVINNVSIIQQFLKDFKNNVKEIRTPLYLERVNSALDELVELNTLQQTTIREMGTTVISTFNRATAIMSNMNQHIKELEAQTDKAQSLSSNILAQSSGGGGIVLFPSFNYTGGAKLLLIREYTPCAYLTSFVRGYYHHLTREKNKRVKLVFCVQKGQIVLARYYFCTSITLESMSNTALYNNDIIVTNNPKNEVMKNILKDREVIIVVDRMYSNDAIVKNRIIKLNAVAGEGDIDLFKLKESETILPIVELQNNFATIPRVPSYPSDQDARLSVYIRNCSEAYTKLDNYLKLEG